MSLIRTRNVLGVANRTWSTRTKLTNVQPTMSSVTWVGMVQPLGTRSISTTWIRYNEKLDKPPVVETPPPTSRIGKFIQQSKDLVRFYKDGVKLLWNNNKQSKALQQKVQNEGYVLNRSEFQLIHQTKKDMLKLIPFGIVFMILPESIPLLVIYVPGMVPGTCIKDTQIQKRREKLDKVRQKMTMNVLKSAEQVEGIAPEDFLSINKFQKITKHYSYDFDLNKIDRRHLTSYCKFMGINDYGPQFILKKRLAKYMNYIDEDDKLLVKENIDDLSPKELAHAVEERGMRSIDQPEDHMRRGLKYWLSITQPTLPDQLVPPPGLLVFSRMFLLNADYGAKKSIVDK